MAIEYCSDNTTMVMSPRISFSYDTSQSNTIPIAQTLFQSNSKPAFDFNFCIGESDEYTYSADEFFSGGKIIPTQIKNSLSRPKKNNLPRVSQESKVMEPSGLSSKKDECCIEQSKKNVGLKVKQSSKSFWGFTRSNSLNCGSGYAPSLCPLPLMSRSNSTGSENVDSRKTSILKESQSIQKQNIVKGSLHVASRTSSLKPPMKKSYHGNGVNPAINVHSGNLFGLGSIFCNGKDKNKKK